MKDASRPQLVCHRLREAVSEIKNRHLRIPENLRHYGLFSTCLQSSGNEINEYSRVCSQLYLAAPRHWRSFTNQAFGFQPFCLTYFGSTSAKNMG